MTEVETDASVLLELSLADGTTNRFPRARIYDAAGTEQTGAPFNSPVDLLHVSGGLYQATTTAVASPGSFSIHYITYNDAGHTITSNKFARVGESLVVVDPVASRVLDEAKADHVAAGSVGEAIFAASGHAGLHAVLDNIANNANNNLTAARLRLFADKATADAATLGAADDADGEIMRLNVDTSSYSAGLLSTVPQVLGSMRRTRG